MTFDQLSDSELWLIANRLMDSLMEGSTAIDHEKHTQHFTPRLLSIVTPEYLEAVCFDYQQQSTR